MATREETIESLEELCTVMEWGKTEEGQIVQKSNTVFGYDNFLEVMHTAAVREVNFIPAECLLHIVCHITTGTMPPNQRACVKFFKNCHKDLEDCPSVKRVNGRKSNLPIWAYRVIILLWLFSDDMGYFTGRYFAIKEWNVLRLAPRNTFMSFDPPMHFDEAITEPKFAKGFMEILETEELLNILKSITN